jgi:hypothetical protein
VALAVLVHPYNFGRLRNVKNSQVHDPAITSNLKLARIRHVTGMPISLSLVTTFGSDTTRCESVARVCRNSSPVTVDVLSRSAIRYQIDILKEAHLISAPTHRDRDVQQVEQHRPE